MKIKLSYKEAITDRESLNWLARAENELNNKIRKTLENYAAFGVIATYIEEETKDDS